MSDRFHLKQFVGTEPIPLMGPFLRHGPSTHKIKMSTSGTNMQIYRDDPKIGETDAQWCGYLTQNGHVISQTTGHLTPKDAAKALGADDAKAEEWNRSFGF